MNLDVIKDELTFADLVRGKAFEFDGTREDYDSELYDQIDEDELEHIQEEAVKMNPWQHKYEELRGQMKELCEGVYKRTMREGIDGKTIPDVSVVKVHYNAYFEGQANSFDSTYMRGAPLTFTLGKGTVLEGLEKAIRSMLVEEESQFIISSKLLYGDVGCAPRIPPKADALFIIRVLETKAVILPPHLSDLTEFYQRYHEASMMESTAKRAFKSQNVSLAINNYKRAVHELEFSKVTTDHEDQLYTELMTKLFLNLAVCYNRERKPLQTIKMIEKMKTLRTIDRNPKALYQEGRAYTTLGDYQKARTSLTLASRLAPEDENVISAIQTLELNMTEDKKAKKIFAQNALQVKAAPPKPKSQKEIDETTKRSMKALLKPFIESEEFSLKLPSELVRHEVACLKSLEEELRVKLVISSTSLGPEYKIMKKIPAPSVAGS